MSKAASLLRVGDMLAMPSGLHGMLNEFQAAYLGG